MNMLLKHRYCRFKLFPFSELLFDHFSKLIFYLIFKLRKNISFKDTHREKTPSNKTSTLKKGKNISVWVVST